MGPGYSVLCTHHHALGNTHIPYRVPVPMVTISSNDMMIAIHFQHGTCIYNYLIGQSESEPTKSCKPMCAIYNRAMVFVFYLYIWILNFQYFYGTKDVKSKHYTKRVSNNLIGKLYIIPLCPCFLLLLFLLLEEA